MDVGNRKLFAFSVPLLQQGQGNNHLRSGFRSKLHIPGVTIGRIVAVQQDAITAVPWCEVYLLFSFLKLFLQLEPFKLKGRILHVALQPYLALTSSFWYAPTPRSAALPVPSPGCSSCLSPTCLPVSINAPQCAGNSEVPVCRAPCLCLHPCHRNSHCFQESSLPAPQPSAPPPRCPAILSVKMLWVR